MARTKNINPSAAVRQDPATEYVTESQKPQKPYKRCNIFVPEEMTQTWEDFKVYAASIDISVSELINLYMADTVKKHAAEIQEAKARFEKARKHYTK